MQHIWYHRQQQKFWDSLHNIVSQQNGFARRKSCSGIFFCLLTCQHACLACLLHAFLFACYNEIYCDKYCPGILMIHALCITNISKLLTDLIYSILETCKWHIILDSLIMWLDFKLIMILFVDCFYMYQALTYWENWCNLLLHIFVCIFIYA